MSPSVALFGAIDGGEKTESVFVGARDGVCTIAVVDDGELSGTSDGGKLELPQSGMLHREVGVSETVAGDA